MFANIGHVQDADLLMLGKNEEFLAVGGEMFVGDAVTKLLLLKPCSASQVVHAEAAEAFVQGEEIALSAGCRPKALCAGDDFSIPEGHDGYARVVLNEIEKIACRKDRGKVYWAVAKLNEHTAKRFSCGRVEDFENTVLLHALGVLKGI